MQNINQIYGTFSADYAKTQHLRAVDLMILQYYKIVFAGKSVGASEGVAVHILIDHSVHNPI